MWKVRLVSLPWMYMYAGIHFAHLQSGPVSIEVQRWFNLQYIVPKIFPFKYMLVRASSTKFAKSCRLFECEYLRNDALLL